MIRIAISGGRVQSGSFLRNKKILLIVAAPARVKPLPYAGLELVEVGGHAEVLGQPRLVPVLSLAAGLTQAEVTGEVRRLEVTSIGF